MDRAKAHERIYGPPKPVIVTVLAPGSLRMRFPDGAALLGGWDDVLALAGRRVRLETADGLEVTALHALARALPRRGA